MGSSVMGAGVLRKKVQDAGLTNVSVINSAINSPPGDVDLVITHSDQTERAMRQAPQAQHISLNNFLDSALYSNLTDRLSDGGEPQRSALRNGAERAGGQLRHQQCAPV
nr:EIICBA-Mtl [Candidatus Pantoea persica]